MSDPVLDFSKDLTDEQRAAAERDVAALVGRAEKSFDSHRELAKEEATLRARINAPLVALVEAHEDAAKAAAEYKTIQERLSAGKFAEPVWSLVRPQDVTAKLAGDGIADEVYGPPYHFSWQWHHDTFPDVTTVDRETGKVQVGSMILGDPDRTRIHAGFGVSLTTNQVRTVSGRSLRRTHHSYTVSAGVLGGVALTEGGTEMTVLEDGNLLTFATDKRWRKRVSSGESESDDSGGFATGESLEVTWTMHPGRTYTFNVGAWVFIEKEDGLGFSGFSLAQANLNAQLLALTVFH